MIPKMFAAILLGLVASMVSVGERGFWNPFGPAAACAASASDCLPVFFPCDECEPSPYDFCSHSQAIVPVEGYRLRD